MLQAMTLHNTPWEWPYSGPGSLALGEKPPELGSRVSWWCPTHSCRVYVGCWPRPQLGLSVERSLQVIWPSLWQSSLKVVGFLSGSFKAPECVSQIPGNKVLCLLRPSRESPPSLTPILLGTGMLAALSELGAGGIWLSLSVVERPHSRRAWGIGDVGTALCGKPNWSQASNF